MSVVYRFTLSALLMVTSGLLPIYSGAQLSHKLYIGHSARLTAQIPADWTVDPTASYDYSSTDGFVADLPLAEPRLNGACLSVATNQIWDDDDTTMTKTTWSGQAACRLEGRSNSVDTVALVVPHPNPFLVRGQRYAFAALIADLSHFDAIVATLDFSPDRVTPEDFVTSVFDIVEARAWWGEDIDWDSTRRETLASIDGFTSVEMARGALVDIIDRLQAAGDNHSGVLFPDESNGSYIRTESTGFGFLVGGQRVLAVFPDGPGARAGIRVGDLIEAVDGDSFVPIMDPIDPAFLASIDPTRSMGISATLMLQRPDTEKAIQITVEQGPYTDYLPPIVRGLSNQIGYITVPHFRVPGQETEFADTAHDSFATAEQNGTCGWIVDLRLNSGGSYAPMINAIGPIMGNGPFIGWRWADDRQTWVTYQDGRILDSGRAMSENLSGQSTFELQGPELAVAVLTSSRTSSAGEITTIAFVGRPDTRLFGEQTGGYTTANAAYPLFDGSTLILAEAAMTDRTGLTHLDGVVPDEMISNDWTNYGTQQDSVLNAAVEWLNQQPGCVSLRK